MRRNNIVVFDDFVAGTPPVTAYTSADLNDVLGAFDELAVHAIADQLSGNITAFSVDLQHSGDGRNWSTKTQNLIASTSISSNEVKQAVGTDNGSTPSLGLVRLAIIATGSTGGQFHLKIYATQRDDA